MQHTCAVPWVRVVEFQRHTDVSQGKLFKLKKSTNTVETQNLFSFSGHSPPTYPLRHLSSTHPRDLSHVSPS
jgi:thioredoxin reductase